MATLLVPPLDAEPWPTLGPQVCEWLSTYGRYGPGDLKGLPYELTPDFEAQIYRAYEVFPRGHRLEGRRRFKRVCFEERKGTAKTERAMELVFAESHPTAPVRTVDWRKVGSAWEPIGGPVVSPYIPLVSYTVEQLEDLAFNVIRAIIEESDLAGDYDVGLERIVVLDARGREAGKIVPLAGSPNARDGARTTFQHFDEPHRMTLPRLVKAHGTMIENTYKRVMADAWTLETTTAGELGEASVAEDTRETAEAINRGEVDDPRLFYFSRFAPLDMPLETPEDVRAALIEASGPNASWSGDIDALVPRYFEPKADRSYYQRVWLNQWVPGGAAAFDAKTFRARRRDLKIDKGALVTLGFDGAKRHDATALTVTDIESGHQQLFGLWQRPLNAPDDWEVPTDEVDETVSAAFDRWNVWRLYADPPYWDDWIDAWEGRYGSDKVLRWWTNRYRQMAFSLKSYHDAIIEGSMSWGGTSHDEAFASHIANAYRKKLAQLDDQEQPLWVIRKERPDSPLKIDAAMSGCLSWEARGDAIAAGVLKKRKGGVAAF